jgi:hypothetical protein
MSKGLVQIWGKKRTKENLWALKAEQPDRSISDILDECVEDKRKNATKKKSPFF